MKLNGPAIILASKSAGRRQLLTDAGIIFKSHPAEIDEAAIKNERLAQNAAPDAIAIALASAKAAKISAAYPAHIVLGSDQILLGPDGDLYSKAPSIKAAKSQLARLSGREHQLISAAAIYRGGQLQWQGSDIARLLMRALLPQEIDAYVQQYWDDIRHCVGCYRIEAEGRALFDSIHGQQSTIIGMPMPPILDYLTSHGYEAA